jgi:choline dehydrogenase-like flavoprotein
MEDYQGDADDEYRGRGGPLKVTESNESGAIYDALIKAAGEVGIAYTKDYNGAKQDGELSLDEILKKSRAGSQAGTNTLRSPYTRARQFPLPDSGQHQTALQALASGCG